MLPVKILAEIAGATLSAIVGLLAAVDGTVVVAGAGVTAVFAFATLLVREVLKQHQTLWQMIDAARDAEHFARWEADKLRFTYGERPIDPGPYVPRRQESHP